MIIFFKRTRNFNFSPRKGFNIFRIFMYQIIRRNKINSAEDIFSCRFGSNTPQAARVDHMSHSSGV